MGARFLAVAFFLSVVWYAWRWHTSGLSAKAALLRISVICFLAAGAGKATGIAMWRMRCHKLLVKR